jgi:tetratricopeptide (TPR) repeat protein
MPETTVLHIQTDDSAATRVLELPGVSVRIGRGSQCEVRLGEQSLAEVQCLLRRRGDLWHVQPVGPSGQIFLEGQPVDDPRPLPLGVPLRIGEHSLMLHRADVPVDQPGTFHAPIPVRGEVAETRVEIVSPSHHEPSTTSKVPEVVPERSQPEPQSDRLEQWKARIDQHTRWLQAKKEERRWEARWKAAGASLRARPTPASPPATPPEPPPVPPVVPPRSPQAPTVSDLEGKWRAWQAPPPRRAPVPPVVTPYKEPPVPIPVTPLAPQSLGPRPSTSTTPFKQAPPIPQIPKRESPVPNLPNEAARVSPEARKPQEPEHLVDGSKAPTVAPACPTPEAESHTVSDALDQPLASRIDARRADVVSPREPAIRNPFVRQRTVPRRPAVEPARVEENLAEPVPLPEPRVLRPPGVYGLPAPLGSPLDEPGPDWPSARVILAAHCARLAPHPAPRASEARHTIRSLPTIAREPEHWTLPFWPTWIASVAITIVVGVFGLALTLTWAQDDWDAGFIANSVLASGARPAGPGTELPNLEAEPPASWWRSTARHLFLWALSSSTNGTDSEHVEQVEFLLHAARNASPVQASVRYAQAQNSQNLEPALALDESLGQSRDVIALAWTGRCLLATGKTDAAVGCFREALQMASRADLADLEFPRIAGEAQFRRYRLPFEDLMEPAVQAMVEHRGWTFSDWSQALPACAIAPLVAARLLGEQGRLNEAEAALDLALTSGQERSPLGCSAAVQHAAEAEAFALRNRWEEAEEHYRQAIALMPDGAFRRSWWLNLADIYIRLNDDAKKRAAWEAAKGTDANEEITRRAVRYQSEAGIRSEAAVSRARDTSRTTSSERRANRAPP